MLPLQPFSLSSPFIPPQFQSYLNNFMKNFYTPFIYKDYHINLGGPSGDHITGSLIYEDALPPSDVYSSYKTLRERNALSEYIRGTFIKSDEGEIVSFDGGSNSLNSRLKLIELNPYNTNMFSDNPYKGLPKNLLIYKSCYPIVYDKQSTLVQCNKLAVGLNIRAYKLTLKEYIVKYFDAITKMSDLKLNDDIESVINKIKLELKDSTDISILYPEMKIYKFDVWREIIYYAWIRNKINSLNICPNFVSSYCYFIDKNANLSFAKNGLGIDLSEIDKFKLPEILSKEFTNSSLILLTESPNQNIYQWGSNIYVQDKGIRKMIQSGFKPESHWKSVISQMIIIFYIMDKYCFTIREIDINSNFYIKDLNIYGDNKQYWQYTIENIDFYIPNFGHLVMFDHNYKDLKDPENIRNKEFKIVMKDEFGDDQDIIRHLIIKNAINCFNSNNFGSVFLEIGGVGLSGNIGNLLNNIEKDLIDNYKKITEEKNKIDNFWSFFIKKYLIDYVHNRIGTPIRDLEINYIRKTDNRPRPFKIGELVIHEEKFETYKIILVIENNDALICKCITKNLTTNEYEQKDFSKDLLYHYSEYETIKQDGKLGEPVIGYEHIIERYFL